MDSAKGDGVIPQALACWKESVFIFFVINTRVACATCDRINRGLHYERRPIHHIQEFHSLDSHGCISGRWREGYGFRPLFGRPQKGVVPAVDS